jgi:predicted glycosyltransferase
MKIFIDIGHPAHVHYFKNFISHMSKKGHVFKVTAREKECTIDLLNSYQIPFHSRGTGSKTALGKLFYMFKADWLLMRIAREFKPDLFLSFASPYAAQVAWLLNKPHIAFDDTDHIRVARAFYLGFSSILFTPFCFNKDVGNKQLRFKSFMELFYLHPNLFTPDQTVLNIVGLERSEKFIVLRFVSWEANHDIGISGMNTKQKHELINELVKNYRIFISSESELPENLRKYKLDLPPHRIHDLLAFASLVVSEGATMASECAMLGTPVIYVNPLDAGTLHQQEKYGLLSGFRDFSGVIKQSNVILDNSSYKVENILRRDKVLKDLIDPNQMLVKFFENGIIKNRHFGPKRFLFYLVHPAKFQFHKLQIHKLKEKGYTVDVIINTKDILEDLLKEEGWEYTNIFPKSRKIKGVHVYLAAFISIFLTIYRLLKYTRGKKYDLFVGDLLSIVGKIKGVPAFYATDDVLAAVPEQAVFFKTVKYIIAPEVTDIGKYKTKKIGYRGYKALAHLHPNHFIPDESRLAPELMGKPYFLIRCTGFGATHDIGKSGISDEILQKLIPILEPHGQILITAERKLSEQLQKYSLKIRKNDIAHYIKFAYIFIGDSTTMCTEAAVLGTPAVEFDEYFYEIEQMLEIERKYQLIHCFRTYQQNDFLDKVTQLVNTKDLSNIYAERRKKLLHDMIDVSSFLVWLFENNPESVEEYFENPEASLVKFKNTYKDKLSVNLLFD